MKQMKNKLYGILDELYTAAQALQDFQYVLAQLYESYPVTDSHDLKAVITCCRIYTEAVEQQLIQQLDVFDETLTGM